MRYPNPQKQQIVDKIERREKQIRMLAAGAIEAVMQQLHEEIADLRAYLKDLERSPESSKTR